MREGEVKDNTHLFNLTRGVGYLVMLPMGTGSPQGETGMMTSVGGHAEVEGSGEHLRERGPTGQLQLYFAIPQR